MDGVERTLIRRIFDSAPKGSINLGLGQPDLPSPEAVCRAGIDAIGQGRTGYTSTAGDPELRAAVAARYPGHADGPDGVAITVGTQEALFASLLVLTDPGDEVLIPDPGYPGYATAIRLLGAVPVTYPLRSARAFRVDPDDVVGRIGARTRVVLLCSPSNPTGAMHADADLADLTATLAARGVAWLSDEVYAGFCYDAPLPVPRRHVPHGGLTIGGLSKDAAMTGWRIGWVAGAEETVARIVAAHQYLVTCASSVSQRAALGAFSEAGVATQAAYRDRFRARRERMGEALREIDALSFARPDGAFYYFVRVAGCTDSEALALRILGEEGVITIPGIAFGPNGEGWLRLSFAASEDDIDRGVAGIAKVLARS